MPNTVLISKTEVKSLLSLLKIDKQYSEIYISNSPLRIHDVKDTFGKQIFNDHLNTMGWLVFIDLCKIANWSHPCEYLFVVSSTDTIKSTNEQWRPEDNIKIERLEENLGCN